MQIEKETWGVGGGVFLSKTLERVVPFWGSLPTPASCHRTMVSAVGHTQAFLLAETLEQEHSGEKCSRDMQQQCHQCLRMVSCLYSIVTNLTDSFVYLHRPGQQGQQRKQQGKR